MLAVTFISERMSPIGSSTQRLAHGPVVEGKQLLRCAPKLQRNPDHAKTVLLGGALAHAYRVEKEAPPFGIAIHETAATCLGEGNTLSGKYLEWWKTRYSRKDDCLLAWEPYQSLKAHYLWCSYRSSHLDYPKEAMNDHRAKVDEYFAQCRPPRKPSKLSYRLFSRRY